MGVTHAGTFCEMPGFLLSPHRLTASMPIEARCVHAVLPMPVVPEISGAQWRAWCGALGDVVPMN